MIKYKDTEENFNTDYAKRVDSFSKDEKYKKELDYLSQSLNLKKDDYLLDVGCGSGNAMFYFRDNIGCSVKGIEKIKEYTLLSKYPEDIVISDAQLLPFGDEVFDKDVIIHVIGHIEDPIKALKEVKRVTKNNGRLGIITPNKYFIFAMKPLNWLGLVRHKNDITRIRLYSSKSIKKDLEKAGWNNIKCETFGSLPRHLRFLNFFGFMSIFQERVIAIADKI